MFRLTPFSASPRRRDDVTDFSDLLDDFFSPMRSLRHDTFKLDVEEKDNAYHITADLPGVKKDELKVSYDDQTLTIQIDRDESTEDRDEEKRYLHKERRVCSMKRALHLPDVDPSKLKAKLEDGILRINAEKSDIQNKGYVIDVE